MLCLTLCGGLPCLRNRELWKCVWSLSSVSGGSCCQWQVSVGCRFTACSSPFDLTQQRRARASERQEFPLTHTTDSLELHTETELSLACLTLSLFFFLFFSSPSLILSPSHLSLMAHFLSLYFYLSFSPFILSLLSSPLKESKTFQREKTSKESISDIRLFYIQVILFFLSLA